MGYAYEDEDINKIGEEEVEEKEETKKPTVEELLEDKGEYSVDDLLKEEEDKTQNIIDLLNKKDKKLFAAYLGDNASKITNNKFNFSAFFFGGAYLIYRKVYTVGLTLLLLVVLVSIFFPIALVPSYITLLFVLLLHGCAGVFANQIILNHVASKILNYKTNEEKDIKKKLSKTGGVNIVLFILSFLVLASSVGYIVYNTANDIINNYTTKRFYREYNGEFIFDQSVNVEDYFHFVVSDEYALQETEEYRYLYYLDDFNYVEAFIPEGYQSASSLASELANYKGTYPVKREEYNDSIWYVVNKENDYYYLLGRKGKIYLIHIKNGEGLNYSDILNSVEFY